MDFVNKAYAQAAELFRSMSPGTRIAAGLLLAVIVVSLVYLFQYQVAGGDEYLLDGRPFSASELTAIEAAFAKAGLGKSAVVGNRIRIPRGQKDGLSGRPGRRQRPAGRLLQVPRRSDRRGQPVRVEPQSLELKRCQRQAEGAGPDHLADAGDRIGHRAVRRRGQARPDAHKQQDRDGRRADVRAARSTRSRSRRSATSSSRPMRGSIGTTSRSPT